MRSRRRAIFAANLRMTTPRSTMTGIVARARPTAAMLLGVAGSAQLAHLQGLGIEKAVDGVAEELPEVRRVDVLRRQRRLVQVGPGPGGVVVVREDIDSGRRRDGRYRASPAGQVAVVEPLDSGAETIFSAIRPMTLHGPSPSLLNR